MNDHPLVARLVGLLEGPDSVLTGTLSGELVRGMSAYDIAKKLGFQGSEEAWLNSLVGESVEVTVLTNTPDSYILQFTTSEGTFTSPNLRADVSDILPVIEGKVDKVTGKGLSTNDYTTEDKTKLDGIETGAQENVIESIFVNGTPQTPDNKVIDIQVPTNNNELTNGAGYQNATEVNTAISNALANIHSFEYQVVQTLPQTGVQGTIYLIADPSGESDSYAEYIYVNNTFEKLGKTSISGLVKDVKINGTSVVNGEDEAIVPVMNAGTYGVAKAKSEYGIAISGNTGHLLIQTALPANIKAGSDTFLPITPSNQNAATFYGLAKAAGDTTQSASNNAVGNYTDNAKTAIKAMLGVQDPSILLDDTAGDGDTDVTWSADKIADELSNAGTVQDVQINGTSILSNGVANVPTANTSRFGVTKVLTDGGIEVDANAQLKINTASSSLIKSGTNNAKPISPYHQHESTFYGLAKAAGDITQASSDNPVGTYTDDAKAAIKTMLGIPDNAGNVQDVQVNGTSILNDGVADIPLAGSPVTLSWDDVADDMAAGRTYKYGIGDQFIEPWTDITSNTVYDNPWRINHFETCEIEGGETKDGMWLENVWTSPFGVQFSHPRAIIRCPNGLAAGTYYFTLESKNGNYILAGDKVSFTTTVAVPEGGRIAGLENSLSAAKANWQIYIYDADGKTILETLTPTFTADGTNLGTVKTSTRNGDANSLNEIVYGWNAWAGSALRQYLNSEAGVGLWWEPYDGWDIAPNELATKAGYLSGLPSSMKEVMLPVKYTTYKNTVNDGGTADVTYDKVGLMSLEQMYINPQIAGEGEPHEWYKIINGTATKWAASSAGRHRKLIPKAVENHKSAQYCRLRSAYRGHVYYTWNVNSTGYANIYYGALSAIRFRPLVFIGK